MSSVSESTTVLRKALTVECHKIFKPKRSMPQVVGHGYNHSCRAHDVIYKSSKNEMKQNGMVFYDMEPYCSSILRTMMYLLQLSEGRRWSWQSFATEKCFKLKSKVPSWKPRIPALRAPKIYHFIIPSFFNILSTF